MFYPKLLKTFVNDITPPKSYEELMSLGGPITWYMADSNKNIITSIGNNTNFLIEIDISSAFPTICNNLFPNTTFINKLNNINVKKDKNIFIATNLKNEQLKQINKICKLVITGIIFDTQDNDEKEKIEILELKKDGCIISCNKNTVDRLNNLNYSNMSFTNFLIESNFSFHVDYFSKYIRCNRTTLLLGKSLNIENFIIKGHYKHVPKKLFEIMFNSLLTGKLDDNLINKIYSYDFFKIIQKNNLKNYLTNYYLTDQNKIIDFQGKYVLFNINKIIDPTLYKKIFVFPTIITNSNI